VLAWPDARYEWELGPSAVEVPICTAQYRSPDVLLGSQRFGTDLDMWSVGCVAAELHQRKMLFNAKTDVTGRGFERALLDAQFALLEPPPKNSSTREWLKSLPHAEKMYGKDAQRLPEPAAASRPWPPECLRTCPHAYADFVQGLLKWRPEERLSAASASQHVFFHPRALALALAGPGKHGPGAIAEGPLDEDVLDYLQNCPTLAELHAECFANNFEPNQCINPSEAKLRLKREYVGYIDAQKPPKTRDLNADKNVPLIGSERLRNFVMALRRLNKDSLHQLSSRVRDEIRRLALPSEFLRSNGKPFLDEDFAENAFVYASVQVMRVGERVEQWHTDGGASLLHAALTIFGSRTVEVEAGGKGGGCISLQQRPGAFYVGNLCALNHRVVHGEHSAGCFCGGQPSKQVQIAVMLRSDYFRNARARTIDSKPGPAELFHIVNKEVAKYFKQEQIFLPDLAAVLAESRDTAAVLA